MSKFYFLLWSFWAFRLTIESVLLALFFSIIISLSLYLVQGMNALSSEILQALFDITLFWFPILWSMTLLLTLFRSLKYIFNRCINHFKLELLRCNLDGVIEIIGYGDLVKVWRKWFMLIIWLVAGEMIIALSFTHMFTSYASVFEWFNIYYLYLFVLSSGYASFIVLTNKCKRVKLVKC